MSAPEKNYKDTILLPETGFPMRGDLTKNEPVRLKKWEDTELYERILSRRMAQGAPRFLLHDGPPFANGDVHMGTALNKILKDLVLKSKTMAGYAAPYVPGWDCHGLPIEFKVVQKARDLDAAEIRRRCAEFAKGFIDIQRTSFRRLGVFGDWENPYLTMKPAYEANILRVFAKLVEDGAVYQSRKPVQWSYGAYTALAEAEIDYKEKVSTSVFVRFPLLDNPLGLKASMVIWTTTPWTLPANVGLALHPRFTYVAGKFMKNGQTENLVIVKDLLDAFAQKTGWSLAETILEFKGAELENCEARHPFLSRTSTIILADFVTTDTGTGIVHIAPGHGADDYNVGRQYGLPVLSPVDDDGKYTEEVGVPSLVGKHVFDANKNIISMLEQGNNLFGVEEYRHQYPHCWRCHHPIIFRATEQWFCSVDSFKDEAIAACEDVRWVPSWGKDRLRSMVLERTDWCISRQRRWGLPIPVFYCKDCGKPICTDKTIDAIANIFEKKGSNAWFEMEAEDMLPEGFTCPHCGKNAGFEKETDTLDGWFDSGSTHYAAMERDQGFWPATMYIEGLDQYRGWFQSSLLVAVGALGRGAPFKECLTHGWTVDGQGRAMHKSLGNGMDPAEIFNKYGADLLRLWAGSSDYHVDVRCSDDIFKQLSQNYLKFRNTAKFCLDNLTGFDPEQLVAAADMQELDRWAVTRLNSLIRRVFDSYDAYEFHAVSHAINDFCVVDLSSFYFDIIKDRLYCDGENSLSRRSAQTALFLILDAMTRMFAPILAFTCEEIWLAMPHRQADDGRSVLLNCMVQPYEGYALPEDAMDRWARIAAVRSAVNGALEQARADKTIGKSLEAEVDVTVPAEDAFLADLNADTLADLLIVSQVRVTVGDALSVTVAPAQGVKCARCWKVLTSVGTVAGHDTLCPRCAAVVKALPVVE